MSECRECGGRVIEVGGFMVCGSCGLVLEQLVENWGSGDAETNPGERPPSMSEGPPTLAPLLYRSSEVYRLARFIGVDRGTALAVALYIGLRKRGEHVPLRSVCERLTARGVEVSYRRAVKALLRMSRYLHRSTPFSALRTLARRLSLDDKLVERAERVLLSVRYPGGRDPYLVALAAIYIAAEGELSYYGLAKETGRSPSRIRDNVLYLLGLLQRSKAPD